MDGASVPALESRGASSRGFMTAKALQGLDRDDLALLGQDPVWEARLVAARELEGLSRAPLEGTLRFLQ